MFELQTFLLLNFCVLNVVYCLLNVIVLAWWCVLCGCNVEKTRDTEEKWLPAILLICA